MNDHQHVDLRHMKLDKYILFLGET